MSVIKHIRSRQILDSRGNPTIETDVILDTGEVGRAAVPSGASTGSHEAHELRDMADVYGGKGVIKAIRNVVDVIQPALVGKDPSDQNHIDETMINLDGTEHKSQLGANAILSVSLASAKAAAAAQNIPFYRYIAELSGTQNPVLPMPMMNLMNGGAHAGFCTDIQEYMIIPIGANSIAECVQIGVEVFHALGSLLKESNYPTTVGDEGGYAPRVTGGNSTPLELLLKAISAAGYEPGRDIVLALDVAASEFFKDGGYHMISENKDLSSSEMVQWVSALRDSYPIVSIEDGCAEDDWDGWQSLTQQIGDSTQIVGDDLLVTNTKLLQKAIERSAANAILIKPNQIGTLSETIAAVKHAQSANWRTIMSHRSGETEDTTIAHLAVGLGCGQIKTGSLSRSERVAKYNELLRISEEDANLKLAKPFNTTT